MRRQLHHRHEGDAGRAADQQSPDSDQRQRGRPGEERRARRRTYRSQRQHAARSIAIDQHAGRDLHRDVAGEIDGRKVAERGSRQLELRRELAGKHGGRYAVEETDEVKRRAPRRIRSCVDAVAGLLGL
jgi:hypothetical protein